MMDITYCWGEVDTDFNVFKCPKREECQRFWTEERKNEAEKTGCIYQSFFHFESVSQIKDCKYFVKKEN